MSICSAGIGGGCYALDDCRFRKVDLSEDLIKELTRRRSVIKLFRHFISSQICHNLKGKYPKTFLAFVSGSLAKRTSNEPQSRGTTGATARLVGSHSDSEAMHPRR